MATSLRARPLRTAAATLAGVLVAGLAVTVLPTPAGAAPLTVDEPGTGASVTISSGEITAGERIAISGTGFVATEGSTGDPLVAVRPYDFDNAVGWLAGGTDSYDPVAGGNATAASEAKHWFVTDHTDDGSFEGWIQAPANLTPAGPLENGDHWLRILSGAFFTSTGTRLTAPITFKVPLTVVEKVRLGVNGGPGGAIYQQGTTFRPSASVTVKARGFDPSTAVTVTYDGAPVTGTNLTTDAEGVLPASARITIPSDATPGQHLLRFATGSNTHDVTITVTPPVAVTVLNPTVRSGGELAFDLANFIGVRGTGQKIAVVVNEQVLACIQADATGAGSGVVTLPTGLADGARSVLFNVGLSCVPPPATVNDLPAGSNGRTITISPTAPDLTVPASAATGEPVTVSGTGFAAEQTLTLTADGTTVPSTLTTDETGAFSGSVTFSGAPGDRRLIATAGSTVAAGRIAVTAPAPSTTSLTLSTSSVAYGASRSATVAVTVDGDPASGPVEVRLGPSVVGTVVLDAAGRATVALPRTSKVGSYVVSASFAGGDGVAESTGTANLAVVKASSTASIKLAKSSVKRTRNAKATLRVTVPGAPSSIVATGTIKVYDGSRRIKTVTLGSSRRGVITVTLPKIRKVGSHRLKIVYGGTGNIKARTSSSVTLKVTK